MLGQVSGSGPSIRAGAVLNGVLHVGGLFTSADGQPATGAAKWTGSQWVPEIGPPIGSLITIESFDSGAGPVLVGNTTTSPNAAYQLNDGQWTAIGQQQCPVAFGPILGFDLGNGAMLYTTGSGVGSASNLYRFAGETWQAVPPGFASVYANKFVVFDDDGSGPIPPALWAFGGFTSAGGVSSGGVARWNGCAGVCYANCDGSAAAPVLNIQDFICFRDHFAAGDPAANCDQSVLSPVLNVADFVCFMNRYAAGCP
jgi:hypothetical protein